MEVHTCNPNTDDGDKKISGVHWPARLAELVFLGFMRDSVSKNKVETIEDDILALPSDLHACSHRQMYLHRCTHMQVGSQTISLNLT